MFAQAVPLFKAMFEDPTLNPTGMPVPHHHGAEHDRAAALHRRRRPRLRPLLKDNRPEAWDQIDIVATHQYQQRRPRRPFPSAPARGRGTSRSTSPRRTLEDVRAEHAAREPLRTSLSLAQQIGAAVNFGTRSWYYFETNYPNRLPRRPGPVHPGGLSRSRSARRTRSAKDVLRVPPDDVGPARLVGRRRLHGDDRPPRRRGRLPQGGAEHGLRDRHQHRGAPKPVTLDVQDRAGCGRWPATPCARPTRQPNDEVTADVTLPAATTAISVDLSPYSINTFAIAMGALAGTASGDGPEPGALTLARNAPNPVRANTTLCVTRWRSRRRGAGRVRRAGPEVARVLDGVRVGPATSASRSTHRGWRPASTSSGSAPAARSVPPHGRRPVARCAALFSSCCALAAASRPRSTPVDLRVEHLRRRSGSTPPARA